MTEPRPEPLIFPEGVRFPRDEEYPGSQAAARERVARANVTTGYVLRGQRGDSYSAYFEANVHAPRIFATFQDLVLAIVPDMAAPIVGFKDEDPVLGPYTHRDAALAVFEPYQHQLQHDGFLEFGVIYQSGGRTEEVFVKSSKHLQIWTREPMAVRAVFARHGIPEVPGLEFIDQYPMVSQSLRTEEGHASAPVVIEALREAFARLPQS